MKLKKRIYYLVVTYDLWCNHAGCVRYQDRDRDWKQNNGGQ